MMKRTLPPYVNLARRFAAAMLFASAGSSLRAQVDSRPTDFFVVSEVTSDASPFWYHYILHVAGAGRDSLVRYIRIAPMDSMCARSVTVKVATVRLADVSPSDLIAAYPICDVDSNALARKLRGRTHTAAIDDSVRFGIVAKCGTREVAIYLPYPEQVNLDRLKKKSPGLARWWNLEDTVRERAFGSREIFYKISAEDDVALQREGEAVVSQLRSGRFDKGLRPDCVLLGGPCKERSFRDELREYAGPLEHQGHTPKLVQEEQYRFDRYVPPVYPALAMQARIQGTVKLNLAVDRLTGTVQDVTIVVGRPLFRDAVIAAVRQWQFAPQGFGENAQRVSADLVFEYRCPASDNP
jgi:TonB family protein